MTAPLLLAAALACSEYTVQEEPDPPVADPPGGGDPGDEGDAPDWSACQEGYLGHYLNLPADHPDLEPTEAVLPVDDPDVYDWWDEDRLAFERYDASLDMGADWWPVDEGFAEDPRYFAARWTAWVRATSGGTHTLVLGASSDVFVLVGGVLVASVQAAEAFEPAPVAVDIPAGQFPLEVRSAHRMGDSALRVRFAGEELTVCYPNFSD